MLRCVDGCARPAPQVAIPLVWCSAYLHIISHLAEEVVTLSCPLPCWVGSGAGCWLVSDRCCNEARAPTLFTIAPPPLHAPSARTHRARAHDARMGSCAQSCAPACRPPLCAESLLSLRWSGPKQALLQPPRPRPQFCPPPPHAALAQLPSAFAPASYRDSAVRLSPFKNAGGHPGTSAGRQASGSGEQTAAPRSPYLWPAARLARRPPCPPPAPRSAWASRRPRGRPPLTAVQCPGSGARPGSYSQAAAAGDV